MAYSDVINKLGQIKQANLDLITKQIPPGKGGSPGQPYDPPKPTGPYVPSPTAPTKVANLTPKMFTPFDMGIRDEEGGLIPHIITPSIRDAQMNHFKRFIKNSGESTWDLSQGNSPMMIAKGKKKKKNKALTIYDESARSDALRDMSNEPYDPDTGRLGGGFDIMNDLLDGV